MNKAGADKKIYRVVQWATGNIGTHSLRSVIKHPRLELAGVYVHSTEKNGKDAGELCGLPPIGVMATRNIEDILALKADCVLYMQQGANIDDICRILEAGSNIVTTRVEFHNPPTLNREIRERIEAACKRGGASIHSTGSSPGFITEALPIPLLSLQRHLDELIIDEFADLTQRNSPDLLFNVMGYGKASTEFGEHRLAHIQEGFAHSLSMLADAIGSPLDSIEIKGENAVTRCAVKIAAGTLEKGTVGAQRIVLTGIRKGKPFLQMRMNWYATTEIVEDWQLGETGWRVQVKGDTPLDVRIRFPIPLEQYGAVMPGLTAHRAVNAVPVVCAADPGIRTTAELPQVLANLGD
jgi:2,4-diaminopentanoate dehydrogenase